LVAEDGAHLLDEGFLIICQPRSVNCCDFQLDCLKRGIQKLSETFLAGGLATNCER